MNDFLQVKNIQIIYQTPKSETLAVQDVSFGVKKGEFVSIVGPSGCGKSTLLSAIAGLNSYQKGEILLEGKDIKCGLSKIGYMLQKDNLLPWRTIEKNTFLALEVNKTLTDQNKQYALSLLEKYGLGQFKDAYPANLSGGMRQRVALIRTLAAKPDLLLLDEAFSALDYQTRVKVSCDVHSILKKENKTMVMVTHDIPEAVAMSDKIIILSARPSKVKKVIPLNFKTDDPVLRRSEGVFQDYFNMVWREL